MKKTFCITYVVLVLCLFVGGVAVAGSGGAVTQVYYDHLRKIGSNKDLGGDNGISNEQKAKMIELWKAQWGEQQQQQKKCFYFGENNQPTTGCYE